MPRRNRLIAFAFALLASSPFSFNWENDGNKRVIEVEKGVASPIEEILDLLQ